MQKQIQFQMQQAFTLIELLMTIALVSVLLSLTWPSLNHFLAQSQADAAQSQLIHLIQFAQLEAEIRNAPIVLCNSQQHRGCSQNGLGDVMVFVNAAGDGEVKMQDEILAINTIPGKLYWQSYPSYRQYVLFAPYKLRGNDNGSFWYCPPGKDSPVWALVLSQFGRIQVIYPDKSGQLKDSSGRILRCS